MSTSSQRGTSQQQRDGGRDESPDERADRQLSELLQELRVAQAGVQILFAFLLVIPFQETFDSIPHSMKLVHAAALLFAMAASAFIIGPVALHRVTFRQRMKPKIVLYAHRMALVGLAFLALAMSAAILLALDLSLGRAPAVVAAACALVLFTALWFVWPFALRTQNGRS